MEKLLCHLKEYADINNNSSVEEIYNNTMQIFGGNILIEEDFPKKFALRLYGNINTYGLITFNPALAFNKNIQIDFFLKIEETKNQIILLKENSFKVELNSSNKLLFSIYHNGMYNTLTSINSLKNNTVYKITLQYNGYYMYVYIDALLDNLAEYKGFISANNNNLYIGADNLLANNFNGYINSIRLKDDLDSNEKIFADSYVSQYSDLIEGESTLLAVTSGFRVNLKTDEPIISWSEGLKDLLELYRQMPMINLEQFSYRNTFYEIFNNKFGNKGYIDTELTSAYWQNNVYYRASSLTNTIYTNNMLPFKGLQDFANPVSQDRTINYILVSESLRNINSQNNFYSYSINNGATWTNFNLNTFVPVFAITNNLKFKIIINDTNTDPATTGIYGFAFQIFE